MTLFDIDKSIEEAMQFDPETGELLTDPETLDALLMEKDEKVINIACFIKNLKAESSAIADEIKNMQARKKRNENTIDWLEGYLSQSLNGEKFSSPKVAISYRKSTSVQCDLEDVSSLPERFLRFTAPSLDKTAVKEAIKNGETVEGCSLVEKVSMVIK